MVVKPRGRNVSTPLMFLNGDALEYVDSVKYLGVLLSHDMKDDADMSRHLRIFYARSNVIFRKFHHYSASIKVNLITTYAAFQSPRANGAHDFPSGANRSIHVPTGNFPFAPLEKWRRFF